MKRILYFSTALLFLYSCGDKATTIDKLNEQKDSLIAITKGINEELAEIETKINELDTNFVKRLAMVSTSEVSPKTFTHYFNIHGVVESDRTALLLPEAGGIIKRIHVKVGDRVKSGQVLARLDAAVAKSRLAELQTAYDLAKTVFEKQERLWNQKIGSEIEYLQAKNNKESLEATMNTVRSQLNMSSIKAPYSGIIDEVFSNVGEMASPMRPVFRIVNNGAVYLSSEVSENHINDVSIDAPVEVMFPSLGDTIQSKIIEIGEYINPENRSFKIRVDLNQEDKKYLPNLLAGMKIRDYLKEDAIVIKSSLIQQSSDGKDFVYLLRKDEDKYFAEKRLIQVGREYQGETEVLDGLSSGDMMINEGARTVRNGQRIRLHNTPIE